jgi:hypothetical protein
MRALCLREVNSGLAEKEAQIGLGEERGDLPDGVFERWVAAGHERSPEPPTAISAARSTRCLAGLVNYIRRKCGSCPVWGGSIVRRC